MSVVVVVARVMMLMVALLTDPQKDQTNVQMALFCILFWSYPHVDIRYVIFRI